MDTLALPMAYQTHSLTCVLELPAATTVACARDDSGVYIFFTFIATMLAVLGTQGLVLLNLQGLKHQLAMLEESDGGEGYCGESASESANENESDGDEGYCGESESESESKSESEKECEGGKGKGAVTEPVETAVVELEPAKTAVVETVVVELEPAKTAVVELEPAKLNLAETASVTPSAAQSQDHGSDESEDGSDDSDGRSDDGRSDDESESESDDESDDKKGVRRGYHDPLNPLDADTLQRIVHLHAVQRQLVETQVRVEHEIIRLAAQTA